MLSNRETTASAGYLCRSLGRIVGCGRTVEREQNAEFNDQRLTAEAVRERWNQLEPQLDQTLRELPPAALIAEVEHPRRGQLTGFEVLVVALRHAAEHMGQADLTGALLNWPIERHGSRIRQATRSGPGEWA